MILLSCLMAKQCLSLRRWERSLVTGPCCNHGVGLHCTSRYFPFSILVSFVIVCTCVLWLVTSRCSSMFYFFCFGLRDTNQVTKRIRFIFCRLKTSPFVGYSFDSINNQCKFCLSQMSVPFFTLPLFIIISKSIGIGNLKSSGSIARLDLSNLSRFCVSQVF